jgi:hypothetical protein
VFRLTHYMDPVPHLPLDLPDFQFVHVQTEVYYNQQGKYKICKNVEDNSCADQYSDLTVDLLHASDHCESTLVPNGQICDPVGCTPMGTGAQPIVV